MEVIDVEPQETHGGSMRYVIAHKGSRSVKESVNKQLQFELDLGLTKPETFNEFRESCERYRSELINPLNTVKSQGKSIAGYAATSKALRLLIIVVSLQKSLIAFMIRRQLKVGKFSPGAHIPIVDHAEFKKNYPHYALLFGYNHEKEIMAKEQEFIAQGRKWITYVPEVRVVG